MQNRPLVSRSGTDNHIDNKLMFESFVMAYLEDEINL